MKPFVGIDGNVVVDDLPIDHVLVNQVLDGTWRPTFWVQQFWPRKLFTTYPALHQEYLKRRQRRMERADA